MESLACPAAAASGGSASAAVREDPARLSSDRAGITAMRACGLLLLLTILIVGRPAAAEERPAYETDAPAAFIGYGLHYGGAGLAATYSHGLLPWLTVTPRLGAGFLIGMVDADGASPFGWAAGLAAVVGRQHRGFVDLGWARGGVESVYLHGSLADSRGISGPTGTVGYEYISDGGFVVRLALDLFAGAFPRSSVRQQTWQTAIGVGVGVHLW